ncbi:uncharacterized protein LOC117122640 [Anneissia japonica]|uniref:uncharacterized protein LOC117122640 n=1 Tax=Anneissia japonica TaxID=1529436 RepID=UPI00142585CA|nr:uncharacterized protein LOC117122640 [Anneissia japonica]
MISQNSKLLLLLVVVADVCSQYQQECHSLDSVMQTLISNVKIISRGTAPTCVKSADCTSMSCYFDLMGKSLEMSIKLSPCSEPPQMTFMLKDASGNINFNKNITHQTTFNLPTIGIIESSIRVDFQPVANGVQFGLFLVTSTLGVPITTPIVPDQVIRTPPCTPSSVPKVTGGQVLALGVGSERKCTDMDDMLSQAQIPDGFDCQSHQNCNGFRCNGTVQSQDLQLSLYMDPCSTPVSYNITITSASLGLVWSHNFTHTETVDITPSGSSINYYLDLTMTPDPNTNTIATSITIRGCTSVFDRQICPLNKVLLDSLPVPVPPCASALPSSSPTSSFVMATTPHKHPMISSSPTTSTECTAWAGIVHDMLQTANGFGTTTCNVTTNCTGIVCLDVLLDHEYLARMDLRHCVTPVELWMSIKSDDGKVDWQQTFTHGDTVGIPGTSDAASFVVTLGKPDDQHVELGLKLIFNKHGLSYSEQLIENQLIPVEPCNGINSTDVSMTTSKSGKTDKVTGGPTMKVYGMTTGKIGNDKPNQVPVVDGDSSNIGVVLGVLLAGMIVLCVIAGLLYFNRRRRILRADERALVEDSFAEI